jgi:hypothetical protein
VGGLGAAATSRPSTSATTTSWCSSCAAHDPTKEHGFVNVVVNVNDLSSSIWVWYRSAGQWQAQKIIEIPPEPAEVSQLPPALVPFGAEPPLVTDIDLSVDDRFLYVCAGGPASCASTTCPTRSGRC